MNLHFNHAKELTPEVAKAVAMLADAGIPLGAQTVLLAGVNDSVEVMKELVHKLVKNRVRPYYLYQCDLVHGAGHFRTTVSKGIEIIEGLRGHTSGYAIPTYVVDAPGGGGKIPVMPQYLISQAPGRVVLRNFEGFITTYDEPNDYTGHTVARSERGPRDQELPEQHPGQDGVHGLLTGERKHIKPEGFDTTHARTRDAAKTQHGLVRWDPVPVQAEVLTLRVNGNGKNGHNGNGRNGTHG
jgi:lysine 2,3-aminomutase